MRILKDHRRQIPPNYVLFVGGPFWTFFRSHGLVQLHVFEEFLQVLILNSLEFWIVVDLWLLYLNRQRCVSELLLSINCLKLNRSPLDRELRNGGFCKITHFIQLEHEESNSDKLDGHRNETTELSRSFRFSCKIKGCWALSELVIWFHKCCSSFN